MKKKSYGCGRYVNPGISYLPLEPQMVLCGSTQEPEFETSEGVSLPGYEGGDSFDNYSWD